MKRSTKLMGVVLGTAALAAAAFGGTAVFADTPEEAPAAVTCPGYGWQGAAATDVNSVVTDLLGITAEELSAARLEGKSLVEIAADYGVTEQELVDAIMAVKVADIEELVIDGTITQEQADLMIERMEDQTAIMVNRTTVGAPEWAGGFGNGYGQSNYGMGPGMMNRYGGQSGQGGQGICGGYANSYGESSLGTGPGGMRQWGRSAR